MTTWPSEWIRASAVVPARTAVERARGRLREWNSGPIEISPEQARAISEATGIVLP